MKLSVATEGVLRNASSDLPSIEDINMKMKTGRSWSPSSPALPPCFLSRLH